jgi:hypothetical protein
MKGIKKTVSLGGLALVGLGIGMAVTNPKPSAYNDFAAKKLSQYLQENVCDDVPNLLQKQCQNFANAGQDRFRKIAADTTERQNFIFFSIYETNISTPPGIPSYHFATVGIFNQFRIYKAEEKE